MPVLRWISRWEVSSIKSLRIRRTCNIVKALFAIVIPPVFKPKVLFMMLQIRPDGVAHFAPVRVAHIVPESLAHFVPVEVAHYTPVCSSKAISKASLMKCAKSNTFALKRSGQLTCYLERMATRWNSPDTLA